MIRPMTRLILPACASLTLLIATTADASFTATTSMVTVNTNVVGSGTAGGQAYTFSGTTANITFVNFTSTGNTTGTIPAVNYSMQGAYNGSAAPVTITELITITNTSANGTVSTGSFTETSYFLLNSIGLFANGMPTVSPTALTLGDTTFTVIAIASTSAQFGQTTNHGAISAAITATPNVVPEPASIALLGLGLAGVGVAARRRRLAHA